ncbi:WXG100 family type VII secretion target [Plantactinospora sp. GCM10030261]|uniref:WXG100 family type VII secretion target n=1 Tax=Plantactinospora sp. GCM10030261 TaxID=3273420 RepID=UPI003622AD6F
MVSPNTLIATTTSTDPAWRGSSLAEGFQGLHQSVSGGSWVDGMLAGGSFALEAAATVIDPFSALLANGLGWAMEHFEPLREVLDKLAGIPDMVTAHAETWRNMAGALQTMAEDLAASLASDLPDWVGGAADAYQYTMANNVDGIGGLSVLAATMASATEAAGNLVQFTRDIVRDLIADLVARVIVWAAEALLVVTIPLVAAQIASAVLKWSGRIFGYTMALITSLTNLKTLMGD